MKSFLKEICRNFLFAEKYHPAIFEEKSTRGNTIVDVNGLACKSNKTIAFVAMDSLLHYPFAEKLGIDLSKYRHKTTAVIIEDKVSGLFFFIFKFNILFFNSRWNHITFWKGLLTGFH